MTLKMIVNSVDPEEIRIALLDNGKLTDFDIETRVPPPTPATFIKGVSSTSCRRSMLRL